MNKIYFRENGKIVTYEQVAERQFDRELFDEIKVWICSEHVPECDRILVLIE